MSSCSRPTANKGLQVVGVSVDDTADKLKPFATEFKMNYPVLVGLGRDDLQDAYGPMWGIPDDVRDFSATAGSAANIPAWSARRVRERYQGASCSNMGHMLHVKGSPTLVWPAAAGWCSAPASKAAPSSSWWTTSRPPARSAPRARPADLRLPRSAAPVDATGPARRGRIRRRRLVVGLLVSRYRVSD